jgi:hypothetical protein
MLKLLTAKAVDELIFSDFRFAAILVEYFITLFRGLAC